MYEIGFSGKFNLRSWYTCFAVFNCFDMSFRVAVNIDSEELEIRSFFFYVFRFGYTAANVARCICSLCREGAVSEKTA